MSFRKRVLSVIVSVVMSFAMLPAFTFTAYAADEVQVSNYDQLYEALAAEGEATVVVQNDIDISRSCLYVKGTKILDLNGKTLSFGNMTNSDCFGLNDSTASLTVNGGTGAVVSTYRTIFSLISGKLVVNGGTYTLGENSNSQVFAVWNSEVDATVNSGRFVNMGSTEVAHLQSGGEGAKFTINGGTFCNQGTGNVIGGPQSDMTHLTVNYGSFACANGLTSYFYGGPNKTTGSDTSCYINGVLKASGQYDISEISDAYNLQVGPSGYFRSVTLVDGAAWKYGCLDTTSSNLKMLGGEKALLKVSPSSAKYQIDGVSSTYSTIEKIADEYYLVTPKNGAVTITPTASDKPVYTVTKVATQHGTTTLSATSLCEGEGFRVYTDPDTGYGVKSIEFTDSVGNPLNVAQRGMNYIMPAQNITVVVTYAPQYSLTINAVSNGSVTSSVTKYFAGDKIPLVITPDDDYELAYLWNADSGSKLILGSDSTITAPAANLTIAPEFQLIPSFSIQAALNSDIAFTIDKTEAKPGETVTLGYTLAPGKAFVSYNVTCNGNPVTVNEDGTFTMPRGNVIVNAETGTAAYYSIAIQAQGPGQAKAVNGTGAELAEGCYKGGKVYVNATPNDGYYLDRIEVTDADGNSVAVTGNSFVMPGKAVTVKPFFEAVELVSVDSYDALSNALTADTHSLITLTGDISMHATINVQGTHELNLNNHSINIKNSSNYLWLADTADLTVGGGTINTEGGIFVCGGKLVIKDGFYYGNEGGNGSLISIGEVNCDVTIEDGYFEVAGYGQECIHTQNSSTLVSKLTINGGEFYSADYFAMGAPESDNTTLTVNKGTFRSGVFIPISLYGNCPNKQVGTGKVMYLGGVKSSKTNLNGSSLDGDYKLIQVGAASDYVTQNIVIPDGATGGMSWCGSMVNSVTALKGTRIPVTVTATADVIAWSATAGEIEDPTSASTILIPSGDGTVTVDLHSHEFSNMIDCVPATDKTAGIEAYILCSCGQKYDAETHTPLEGDALKVIPAIGDVKLSAETVLWDGKIKNPTVSVKDSEGNDIDPANYVVNAPAGRANVGVYTYEVTFSGKYAGSKTLTLTITPAGTKILKVTAGAKKAKVKWAKQPGQATGYQIRYSTKRNMKNAKVVKVKGAAKYLKTIKKLKSGKKCYFQVRVYSKIGGKVYYSKWSAKKAVKVK